MTTFLHKILSGSYETFNFKKTLFCSQNDRQEGVTVNIKISTAKCLYIYLHILPINNINFSTLHSITQDFSI